MALMSIDIGTTHCKAAVMKLDGTLLKTAAVRTPAGKTPEGYSFYDPSVLQTEVLKLIREVCIGLKEEIFRISITGMAEAGLFMHLPTGKPLTHIIPWFDKRTVPLFTDMKAEIDEYERFTRTGLRNHYKLGLYKMRWLLDQTDLPADRSKLIWLSIPDYIAFLLSGEYATDYTLAARTYLFDIFALEWIDEYLEQAGIAGIALPRVLPSGTDIGTALPSIVELPGLNPVTERTRIAVSGHDHLCAAAAAGATAPGIIYDSVGTAETLMETVELSALGPKEYDTGFSFGRHTVGRQFFWLGSVAAAGGSVEWLRTILGEVELTYSEITALLEKLDNKPTGIIFLPYLTGSNAPQYDPDMSAVFFGLRASHGRAEIIKAVLEGVAYQMEWIRRKAAECFGNEIETVACAGGGTRNAAWMQIKANVSGCIMQAPAGKEATLIGAAWVSALQDTVTTAQLKAYESGFARTAYLPDTAVHTEYRNLFETRYLALQAPVREIMHAGQ